MIKGSPESNGASGLILPADCQNMDMVKLYNKSQIGEAHFTPGSETIFELCGRIFPGMALVSNGAESKRPPKAKAAGGQMGHWRTFGLDISRQGGITSPQSLTLFLQAETFYQKISCHFNSHTTIGHQSHALKNPRGSGGRQPGRYY
jgi:hypothetical protein